MQNLSIKQKLWGLIGLFISILVIYGFINSHAFHTIETDAGNVDKVSVPEMIKFSDIEKKLLGIQDAFNEAIIENDPHKLQEAKEDIEIIQKDIEALKVLFKDVPSELAELEELDKELTNFYNRGVQVSLKHINVNNRDEALIKETEEFAKEVKHLEEKLDKQVEAVKHNLDGNTTEIYEQAESAFYEGLVILVIAIIIGVLIGSLLAKNIISSVESIQSGLNSFFRFLNRETSKAETI